MVSELERQVQLQRGCSNTTTIPSSTSRSKCRGVSFMYDPRDAALVDAHAVQQNAEPVLHQRQPHLQLQQTMQAVETLQLIALHQRQQLDVLQREQLLLLCKCKRLREAVQQVLSSGYTDLSAFLICIALAIMDAFNAAVAASCSGRHRKNTSDAALAGSTNSEESGSTNGEESSSQVSKLPPLYVSLLRQLLHNLDCSNPLALPAAMTLAAQQQRRQEDLLLFLSAAFEGLTSASMPVQLLAAKQESDTATGANSGSSVTLLFALTSEEASLRAQAVRAAASSLQQQQQQQRPTAATNSSDQ
ncbi:u3 small nucleolar RNA-associated protein 10 [Cyclospora cayetanensis]|uniref:U3 small nucleolar RNA-associated protein 10 n=1 Tax=Cyclospora cayetanensis TaxID=88456 RepID=A0A1D3CS97_9EIME|nr:u3 small nucleolar RNA-associated protein 10 [Cyclospora cayetanensis]